MIFAPNVFAVALLNAPDNLEMFAPLLPLALAPSAYM